MGVYSLTKSSIKNWVKYPNMMAGSVFIDLNSDHLIAETILGSNQSSITFDVSTLAAQGYKHLQLRVNARTATAGSNYIFLSVRFNGDSGTNYSVHEVYTGGTGVGQGAGFSVTSGTIGYVAGANAATGNYGAIIGDILDAFSSVKNKTMRGLSGITSHLLDFRSSAWFSTAPITSVTITAYDSSNFVTGSRFSLYASKG